MLTCPYKWTRNYLLAILQHCQNHCNPQLTKLKWKRLQVQLEKHKRGHEWGSWPSNAFLGPQKRVVLGTLCMLEALKARLGQPNNETSPSHFPQCTVPKLPLENDPTMKASLGSISRQLDDMLSMRFGLHMISYEQPRGFLEPKFTIYDGASDHFLLSDALLAADDVGYR